MFGLVHTNFISETFVQNLAETCSIMWNRQQLNGVVRSQTETSAVRFLAKSHKIVRNRVETSELVPYCIYCLVAILVLYPTHPSPEAKFNNCSISGTSN